MMISEEKKKRQTIYYDYEYDGYITNSADNKQTYTLNNQTTYPLGIYPLDGIYPFTTPAFASPNILSNCTATPALSTQTMKN